MCRVAHVHRPARPWVGQSGDEALPLLLTLSSGVKGYTTIHAGSARQALTRLRFICQLADAANELPMSALSSLVSEAVDIVVHCSRVAGSPRVTEVVAVEEPQTGPDAVQFTATEMFSRPRPDQALTWSGTIPLRAARALDEAGYDVRELLEGGGKRVRTVRAVGGESATVPRPRATRKRAAT
jgi:pilus assembly protein CpaF